MGADRYDPTQPGGVPAPKMPSAADVARIPEAVRAVALVMLQLDAATREARKRWNEVREQYKRHAVEERPIKSFEARPIVISTVKLWEAELEQEQATAVYREQLVENNARPTDSRWSPTVLALWARCSIAAQKPA